jgi:hypothetical protein
LSVKVSIEVEAEASETLGALAARAGTAENTVATAANNTDLRATNHLTIST